MDERLIEKQVRWWDHNPRLLEAHLWHLLHQHVRETYGIDMDALDTETAPTAPSPLLIVIDLRKVAGIAIAVIAVALITISALHQ